MPSEVRWGQPESRLGLVVRVEFLVGELFAGDEVDHLDVAGVGTA
jgi:hypothetical protein